MRLFLRLQLAVFVLMAILLVAFGWTQVRRERDLFVSDTISDNRTIARWLSMAASGIWSESGQAAAEQFVSDASSGSAGAHAKVLPLTRERAVESETAATVESRTSDADTVVVRSPLRVGGRTVAVLEVEESMVARDTYVSRSIWRQIELGCWLLASAMILSAVLGYYLVGRPVDRIVRRTRLAGEGDLTTRLPTVGPDELSQIGRAINVMCERIEAAQSNEREATRAQLLAIEQLRRAERLAMVGALATGIAHEIGTPLNVVQIRAAAIERGEEVGEEAAASARIIGEQTVRIARIIRGLLDFARPRVPERVPTDLAALVHRTASLLRPIARKYGVELVDPQSPSQVVLAHVDPGQVEQVVSNLLMNAIQTEYPSGCAAAVLLSVDEVFADPSHSGLERRCARISVKDNGLGIPPSLLKRVFEPFVTTKPAGQGTGLGLSVSESIVREHGGFVQAQSEPGKGAVFTVYLPLDGDQARSN